MMNEHRARIYDAPPRLTLVSGDQCIVLDQGYVLKWADIEPCWEKVLAAIPPIRMHEWTFPDSPLKSRRNNAAFAERHARHVERRRARIVGMLDRYSSV